MRLVSADVDVRPGRERGQFADHVLQERIGDILADTQRFIRTGYAGVEGRRDPGAVQFGIGGQSGIEVARHVDFRDDRDVAAPGIIHDGAVVLLAVESAGSSAHFQAASIYCQVWPGFDLDAPALVVREMQVQPVDLVIR